MGKSPVRPRIPEAGEGKRGEEGYLGYLLRQAGAAYKLQFERALADLGVTQPQFLVLTMLRAYPGASNADIARLTMLTPQTVSVIVANLVKGGAVARRPHEAGGPTAPRAQAPAEPAAAVLGPPPPDLPQCP